MQFVKTPFQQSTNFTKFAVLEPKLMQNFRSKASNLAKIQFSKIKFPNNQFFKPLFLVSTVYPFLKPPFAAFGPHTYTKMKVEYGGRGGGGRAQSELLEMWTIYFRRL